MSLIVSGRAGRSVVVGLLGVLVIGSRAHAYFLDSGRNFDLRARFYSETVVAAEDSQPQTHRARSPFQVISHRNFMNPAFEGKLTSYQPFTLDDFSFRLALWGFYDGIYDCGTSQYDRSRQSIKGRLSFGYTNTAAV